MSIFSRFPHEEIYVVDTEGNRKGPYNARVNNEGLTIDNHDVVIDDGFVIERPLPTGKIKVYGIKEFEYIPKFHQIPPQLIVKFEKNTGKEVSKSQTFNFHDSSNIQIGDHNIQNVVSMLQDLTAKIESEEAPAEEKAQAKELLANFLRHPVVVSILGGAGTTLAKQLLGA